MTLFLDNRGLLDAFRAGDPEALAVVYRSYVDDISRMLRLGFRAGSAAVAAVRDPEQELDLLQEIFVRAFSPAARTGYDGLRPYRPYLRQIARNLLVDRARAARRLLPVRAGAADEADIDELIDADAELEEIEETLDRKRLVAATREYLATVDAELRRYVELRFVEERPQLEAARALGLTRRRVRTLEERAMRGLTVFLERAGLSLE